MDPSILSQMEWILILFTYRHVGLSTLCKQTINHSNHGPACPNMSRVGLYVKHVSISTISIKHNLWEG